MGLIDVSRAEFGIKTVWDRAEIKEITTQTGILHTLKTTVISFVCLNNNTNKPWTPLHKGGWPNGICYAWAFVLRCVELIAGLGMQKAGH